MIRGKTRQARKYLLPVYYLALTDSEIRQRASFAFMVYLSPIGIHPQSDTNRYTSRVYLLASCTDRVGFKAFTHHGLDSRLETALHALLIRRVHGRCAFDAFEMVTHVLTLHLLDQDAGRPVTTAATVAAGVATTVAAATAAAATAAATAVAAARVAVGKGRWPGVSSSNSAHDGNIVESVQAASSTLRSERPGRGYLGRRWFRH